MRARVLKAVGAALVAGAAGLALSGSIGASSSSDPAATNPPGVTVAPPSASCAPQFVKLDSTDTNVYTCRQDFPLTCKKGYGPGPAPGGPYSSLETKPRLIKLVGDKWRVEYFCWKSGTVKPPK